MEKPISEFAQLATVGRRDMGQCPTPPGASTLYSHISRASLSQIALVLTLFVILFQSSLAIAKGDLNHLVKHYSFVRLPLAIFVALVGIGCIYELLNWRQSIRFLERVGREIRYDDRGGIDAKITSTFEELAKEGNIIDRFVCRQRSNTSRVGSFWSFLIAVLVIGLMMAFDICWLVWII